MFKLAAILGLLGLAAATAVIIWSGWAEVVQAVASAGWGIVAVAGYHMLSQALSAASWQVLIPGKNRPSWLMFFYFIWIRASVNNLMPVARIGGEVAAVRVMIAHGMRKNIAIASTVVELTLSIVAVFTFVLTGVILFALRMNDHHLVAQLAWGVLFSMPAIAGLIAVQRIGFFTLLSRLFHLMFRDHWASLVGNGAALDRAVTTLYRRHGRIALTGAMQIVAWGMGSGEIALSLHFLGHPLPLWDNVMLEALIQGSASAAFAIPGALGVQEAGFLFFGGMLGLPHDTATALAVMRRCRDLLCYVPGLIIWQAHEGKKLLEK